MPTLWVGLFVYVFCFSLALSVLGIRFFQWFAPRYGFVDCPNERKIHETPTPLLGGAAVFIALYTTTFINLFLHKYEAEHQVLQRMAPFLKIHFFDVSADFSKTLTFFLGGVLIFILGLIDDRGRIGPVPRLIGEILVAVVVVSLGIRPEIYNISHVLGFLIAVGWIVGITNGFNLIDGVNGLCAGNAILSALILMIISVKGGHYLVCMLLVTFVGALTGFIIFNFPKGKIFLGSSGSMFIGYTLSVLVMFQSYGATRGWRGNPIPIVMPALILSFPLIDTLSVMFIRFRRHLPIFKADTNHFHHRLRRLRMNDKEVVLIILLVTFAIGINATLLYKSSVASSIIVLVQALAIYLILAFLVHTKERRQNRRREADSTVFAHLYDQNGRKHIFEGFVVDISTDGTSFCLMNLDKSCVVDTGYFSGKEMKIQLVPFSQRDKGAGGCLTLEGTVRRQQRVAENAVKIRLAFHADLDERQLEEFVVY